jgi:tagatose 6-phosphate kinase
MIKPNLDEIRMLTGKSCDTLEDMVDAAKKIHSQGVEIVAVSLGGEGSFVVSESGVYRARVPKLHAVNTVGCGDSMIAGFALGLSENLPIDEILKKASGISAASALREETGYFRMEDMEKLLPEIEITRIEG